MHHRILVQQQGQKKKRFISPTQIMNNRAVYGDPTGISRLNQFNYPTSHNRVYSPPSNQHLIGDVRQNQQSLKPINQRKVQQQVHRIVQNNNIPSNSRQIKHQIPQSVKSISAANLHSSKKQYSGTLRSKSGKKNYMMAGLARFNKKGTVKNQDQLSSNGSQSRSKGIQSLKGQMDKQSQIQKQYNQMNVYNQKQKEVRRRPRKNDSQTSQKSSDSNFNIKDSQSSQFSQQKFVETVKQTQQTRINLQKVKSQPNFIQSLNFTKVQTQKHTIKQSKNFNKNQNQHSNYKMGIRLQDKQMQKKIQLAKSSQKFLFRDKQTIGRQQNIKNNNLQPGTVSWLQEQSSKVKQITSIRENDLNENQRGQVNQHAFSQQQSERVQYTSSQHQSERVQQKLSFANPQRQQYPSQGDSQINDPNSSSLAIHLKRAHQQKQELRQKKLHAQRQIQDYKKKVQNLQSTITHLRRDLQQTHVQKMSITSQLKTIKQVQNMTHEQLTEANMKNEMVYRQIHQKYDRIVQLHKKSVLQNDQLIRESQDLKTQLLNLHKRHTLTHNKLCHLQQSHLCITASLQSQLRTETSQLLTRLQATDRQLQKSQQVTTSPTHLGSMNTRLMQLQSQLRLASQMAGKLDSQLTTLKAQSQQTVTTLQHHLHLRQTRLGQLTEQLEAQRQLLVRNQRMHEQALGNVNGKLAKAQVDITIMQGYIGQRAREKFISGAVIDSVYKGRDTESVQAREGLMALISEQTEEVNSCRRQVRQKIQQNYQIQAQMEQYQAEGNNLRQQLAILQLQHSNMSQNQSALRQTQTLILQSQVETTTKRLTSMQQVLQWKQREIQQKDEFIQAHLLRITKQQNVPGLLQRLREVLAAGDGLQNR